jgi:hypothetical protein
MGLKKTKTEFKFMIFESEPEIDYFLTLIFKSKKQSLFIV